MPDDFNDVQDRLRYWLFAKRVDGVRVDVPLMFDFTRKHYRIAIEMIRRWEIIAEQANKLEHILSSRLLAIGLSQQIAPDRFTDAASTIVEQ